jgi:glutamate-1-semialdehyde 2,1-aminomutase
MPDPDFHAELRQITRKAGVLLCLDETHTQVVGLWLNTRVAFEPDPITVGKSIAGGALPVPGVKRWKLPI